MWRPLSAGIHACDRRFQHAATYHGNPEKAARAMMSKTRLAPTWLTMHVLHHPMSLWVFVA